MLHNLFTWPMRWREPEPSKTHPVEEKPSRPEKVYRVKRLPKPDLYMLVKSDGKRLQFKFEHSSCWIKMDAKVIDQLIPIFQDIQKRLRAKA